MGWEQVLGSGLGFLGAGLSGGGEGEQSQQPFRYLSPHQMALIVQMIQDQYYGGGDMLGPYAREGMATLGESMAGRGITPGSGVYQAAQSRMMGEAIARASQDRTNNLLALAQARPPMVQGEIADSVPQAGYRFSPAGVQTRHPGQGQWGGADARYAGQGTIGQAIGAPQRPWARSGTANRRRRGVWNG